MATIFISYRREDSASEAGRLADWLSARFGPQQVFMDVDTISPGADFVKRIQSAIKGCDVLLAVIGAKWLTVVDESGNQRLDNPHDYVALEIATALELGKLVIPILVHGAKMPQPDGLPDALRTLANRNACPVSDDRWKRDIEALIDAIKEVVVPEPAGGIESFATKIPTYEVWSDLVVPTSVLEQLREIVDEIVNAAPLAAEWRVTRPEAGPGIQVLFHGDEGTGKTLAAKILAGYLEFDLYKADYGKIMGPQLVDTARNLEQLLDEAGKRSGIKTLGERRAIEAAKRARGQEGEYEQGQGVYERGQGVSARQEGLEREEGLDELEEGRQKREDAPTAILLFDNAETLFGTQSSDQKSSNLLGLVNLRGNLIFTTTSKAELDKKLFGLLGNIVEFPFPDEELRAIIWKNTIPPNLPIEPIDYALLGSKFRLSGEDIRKAVYAAAAAARRDSTHVSMRHLESAAARYNQ